MTDPAPTKTTPTGDRLSPVEPTIGETWLARFLAVKIEYNPPPPDGWDHQTGYPRDRAGRKWEATKVKE